MCLYVDDDCGVTLDSGTRRARKEHQCSECRRTIRAGESYRYWSGLYDGGFAMSKMCAHCWATIDVAAEMTGCPRNWYWDRVFDLDGGEEGDFLGDILANHDLTAAQRAWVRRCSMRGKQRWTKPDGTLWRIPEAVAS